MLESLKKLWKNIEMLMAIIALSLLIGLITIIGRQEYGQQTSVVVVTVSDNTNAYQELSRLLPGEISRIQPVSHQSYRVTVKTKRPLDSLLQIFRGNPKVIDAKLE